MTLYLDCNATTPIDPRVLAEVQRCFVDEVGNAGSPHEFGLRAKDIVHAARERIATVIAAKRNEIVFTSGATESNNLAIFGLMEHGIAAGRRHIVSTQIEHKAVLEPLMALRNRGFEVTLVPPEPNGRVAAEAVVDAVRPDTLLVSVMHVNNETGVIQPVAAVADELMTSHDAFLHVDAAQGFGKDLDPLRHPRIDLMSISSHKIFGPAGVGALMVRRHRGRTIPLAPLMHGGGQELGLRPGTLPVALISGFGLAAKLSADEVDSRRAVCRKIREQLIAGLAPLQPCYHGDEELSLPHVVSVSFPGVDADGVIELLAGVVAVSTGSACTSVCATSSHVLAAMGVAQPELDGAVRISWSHRTGASQLNEQLPQIVERLSRIAVRQS
ncbi:MAG: aminotransferase class V-fold PLP-dependent enzyme [Planctomycetaceae bacterium]